MTFSKLTQSIVTVKYVLSREHFDFNFNFDLKKNGFHQQPAITIRDSRPCCLYNDGGGDGNF